LASSNVTTDYIELEDGQVVEGDKAANIRKREKIMPALPPG